MLTSSRAVRQRLPGETASMGGEDDIVQSEQGMVRGHGLVFKPRPQDTPLPQSLDEHLFVDAGTAACIGCFRHQVLVR